MAGSTESQNHDPASAIRTTVRQLEAMDPTTARYLNALAFVLVRVADVDQDITQGERERMEDLLVEHAGVTAAQAVLVVEIAKHRTQLADCGCAYLFSRDLRRELEPELLEGVFQCLHAVAEADGKTSAAELEEVSQIARELGFTRPPAEA
jgi:uncharacterized tellurite resistance protein B-like protein